MIAKVALILTVVAIAHASSIVGPGLISPGLLRSNILVPGRINTGIVSPRLINTGLVAPGLSLRGAPISYSSRIVPTRLIGASPIALRSGIVSRGIVGGPIGLRRGGIGKTIVW